jgi:putative ABC transport system substrate-binding protein
MIAAYGLNYFQVGYSAGKKAVLVLQGQDPGTVPSGLTENLSLWINLKAAQEQNVTVPEKFINMAEKVFR